jgi:hypothetical protein
MTLGAGVHFHQRREKHRDAENAEKKSKLRREKNEARSRHPTLIRGQRKVGFREKDIF